MARSRMFTLFNGLRERGGHLLVGRDAQVQGEVLKLIGAAATP